MNMLREYIRELMNESYFPIYSGDKMRVHHSREGSRSGGEPQISGFSQKIGPKPNGLWYECQDGSSTSWEEFCTTGMSGGYSKYDSTYNVVLEGDGYYILNIPDEHHFEKFVKMYVNPVTVNMGDPGEQAIRKLFEMAKEKGLVPDFEISIATK